jgi:hypothetical protein
VAKTQEEESALVRPDAAIPATQQQLPEWMRGMAGQGTERLTSDDVELPRLKLLQALSPEVQEGDNRPNSFYHTVAETNLGSTLTIIPLYIDIGYILWRPRKSGGGILARAADGIHWTPADAVFDVTLDNGRAVSWRTAKTVAKSGLDQWGTMDPDDKNSPPAATRMYNIVAFIEEHPGFSPAVVTLQRSGIRVARKFMAKLKLAQAPCFGLRYVMTGEADQNPQGQKFFNYRFTGAGLVSDEETFMRFKAIYERFKAEGVRIRDLESAQDEAEHMGGDSEERPPAGAAVNPGGTKF